MKSQYEDVVINKRFRYEDEVVSTDFQMMKKVRHGKVHTVKGIKGSL